MHNHQQPAYAERFDRVLDYIDQHLDQPLALDDLCRIAHFSKFHFHRQFAVYLGINIGRYILLRRLKQASYRLAFAPQDKVIDIALHAGFETPESFARAFRHTFGQSPTAFRQAPDWARWNAVYQTRPPERKRTLDVKIVNFTSTRIAVKEHRGPGAQLNAAVGVFIDWRKASGLSPKDSCRTFGIAYDNPDTTEPADFRFDIAGEIHAALPANQFGIVEKVIPAGRCACVRHLGSHEHLGDSIYPLYRDWLPHSGENLRDFPLFFHYLNLLPQTPEAELITDIYLPLV